MLCYVVSEKFFPLALNKSFFGHMNSNKRPSCVAPAKMCTHKPVVFSRLFQFIGLKFHLKQTTKIKPWKIKTVKQDHKGSTASHHDHKQNNRHQNQRLNRDETIFMLTKEFTHQMRSKTVRQASITGTNDVESKEMNWATSKQKQQHTPPALAHKNYDIIIDAKVHCVTKSQNDKK